MRYITFFLMCFCILIGNAQYKSKELAFNLNDGRSLYIAKNNDNKVGIVDNNNKIIIPFKFFSAMKVHNKKNAFFIVFPQMGSTMEVYNLYGEKVFDTSRGYTNLYEGSPSPGYIVSSAKGIGMLDVNLNEIIPPIYENISTVLLGKYYLIGTQKTKGDVFKLANKVMDSDWKSYEVPIEGSFIQLYNLIPFTGGTVPQGIIGKTPDVNNLTIIKLKNKPGTTKDKQYLPDAIYFNIDIQDEHPHSIINRLSLYLNNYKLEGFGDRLSIIEKGTSDAIIFNGGKDNIIEFKINSKS